MANKYEKFNEESIIQAQNSYFYKNNPQFDIKTPLPPLVHEKKPQGPNVFFEINPPLTQEVYDPKFNAHYFQNQKNNENMIYISRSYCGGFWIKEFNPIMAHFFLSQEEFEKVVKKAEKIAGKFLKIKIIYFFFFLILIAGLVLIIAGSLYSSKASVANISKSDCISITTVVNFLVGFGIIIIIIDVAFLILSLFCLLKKYEFEISKYFMKKNEKKFMFRNIYWKVGGFCKCLIIQILPFTPQQFWLMQSHEKMEQGKQKEKK